MDKYRLVEEKVVGARDFFASVKGNNADANDNASTTMDDLCVVRITPEAKPRSCITTAMNILEGDNNHVELRAMGKAINKAVTIAEILKRKMPLHQITTLSSCEVVNVYEPLEEGLDTVVNQHYVSCLTITLSRDLKDIDVNDKGYQPPLSITEIQPGQPVDFGKAVAA
jgi:ribonuclease P/MRP protein subunit RPP25